MKIIIFMLYVFVCNRILKHIHRFIHWYNDLIFCEYLKGCKFHPKHRLDLQRIDADIHIKTEGKYSLKRKQ